MDATHTDVLAGNALWSCEQGDSPSWLASLPPDSVDLIIASPPYTACRSYLEGGVDLNIAREAEAWTAWMVDVTLAALRVCTGLVAWVVEGQTNAYRWDAAPMLQSRCGKSVVVPTSVRINVSLLPTGWRSVSRT